MESLASRYASALYALAEEQNQTLAYQTQLREVAGVLNAYPDLATVLSHFKVSANDKKQLIQEVFVARLSTTVLHFLKLLVDKQRFNQIQSICREFISMVNRKRGIKEGVVFSVTSLTPDELKAISAAVEKASNVQVELVNELDPALLGGVRVVVGDTVYDSSIKSKIDSLKYELLEGKR